MIEEPSKHQVRYAEEAEVAMGGDAAARKAIETILENTREAAEAENQLGVLDAFRMYPRAMFWSCFFALAVIMAGYDSQVIFSFFAMPAFTKRYGEPYDGGYQISAAWQTGLSMGSPTGQIIGALLSSWPAERYGRKKTLMVANLCIIGIIFIQFFAPNLAVLCVGEVLAGQFWGAYVTLAPTYASEVSPVALRGILTAFINLAFVIGQFISQGVIAGCQGRTDALSYRIPFALQWLWPVILLVGLPFAPESPWWLVRKGRLEDARGSLKRLAWGSSNEDELDKTLLVIEQTDLLERELKNSTRYMDCFKGANLRRTEICSMAYMIQVLCGNPLMGYYTYFFQQAGLATSKAFYMAVGNTAIGFVATCCTFFALSFAGRRTIFSYGLYVMTLLLFIIGILDCAPNYDKNPGYSWAQASLLDIWTFLYQFTVGPLTFVIISEVSPTKLRSRMIAIATAAQSACSIITTVVVPYMFNPQNANLRGKIGFVFGGVSVLCAVWTFFRLPETQGRTFEEIDIMFERRVKTKDFKDYNAFE
ncbi:alpha-glucosides permease Mph3p [Trichomonascus vanleenenianus]|uniref:alpha-glucosides permease Mph3p n=1 Tax=Trichomonascus vanleenenianus TaxID=2268995 RepID=UPI003ECB4C1E